MPIDAAQQRTKLDLDAMDIPTWTMQLRIAQLRDATQGMAGQSIDYRSASLDV